MATLLLWAGIAAIIGLLGSIVAIVRQRQRELPRALQRMVFPLVDAAMHQRDDQERM